jgi:hypothetical protein
MEPEQLDNGIIEHGSDAGSQPDIAIPDGIDADDAFRVCLRNILRFTDRQINGLVLDGYEKATDLAYWGYDEITNWVNHKEKIHINRGGASYGDMKRKGLIGLAWWVTEKVRMGVPVDLASFDDEARHTSIIEARVEHEEGKGESQAVKPEKFKYESWIEWEKSLYTYLLALKNSIGVPLAYMIRKPSMYHEMDERLKKIIMNAKLEGAVFRSDSQRVLTLLKSLTTATDAENWMKGCSCGRVAMQALQAHYDGDAEAEKRKEAARADLKVLFYRNEASFPFEKYLNRLKKCFDVLEKYSVPYYEEDKVKLLLDRIQCNHAEVKTQVSICRASFASDFVQASTYMAREISRIFPMSNVASINFGRGNSRLKGGRNVSSAGRGRGRGGGKRKGTFNNGIDVSDQTRYYSKEEWAKLDPEVKKKILDNPERKKKKAARLTSAVSSHSTSQHGGDEVSVLSAATSKDAEDRMVSAIIRGVLKSSGEDASSNRSVSQASLGPRHGGRAVSSGQSAASVRSGVTFDLPPP